MASGILEGITVVDMTEGVAGPYCSMLLGDMGANVIKVERPEGDWARGAGKAPVHAVGGAQYVAINRNKRNLGLDLGQRGARDVIERLIGRADVLVSNYRAGVMKRLGLGYDTCRALKPDIVYCTISGFGQEGPYAGRPASDTILQAVSGIMSQVGEPDGPPLRVGFPLVDVTAANAAVQAILLALYGRLAGRSDGAEIDISLMAAAAALMSAPMTDYLASGRVAQRQGNQNPTLAPAGAFQAGDGRFISIATLRDEHWVKLCGALGLEALIDDPRFRTNELRVRNRKELDAILAPMLAKRPATHWLELLAAADILCGPINTVADVIADPALAAGLPLIDPGLEGIDRIMGGPIRWNGAYFTAERPPPAKGGHTREVLAELGFGDAEADTLLRSGAAFVAKSAST